MRIEILCIPVLIVASEPRVKVAGCKCALTSTHPPPPALRCFILLTDRSKAVVPVLVLLFVALCSAFRTYVRFAIVCCFLFPLPPDVWEGLRLVDSLDFSLTFFGYIAIVYSRSMLKEGTGSFRSELKIRKVRKGPICNLQTTQALISLHTRAE